MSACFLVACTENPSAPVDVAVDAPIQSLDADVAVQVRPLCPEKRDDEPALVVKQELIYDARIVSSDVGKRTVDIRLFSEAQIQPPALVIDLTDVKTKKSILSRATAAVSKTYTVVSASAFHFVDDWQGEVSAALLLPGTAKPQMFPLSFEEGKVVPVQQGSILRLRLSPIAGSDKKAVDALTADPWLGATAGGTLTVQTPGGKPLTEPAAVPVSVTGRWFEWSLPLPDDHADTIRVRVRAIDAAGKDIDGVGWEMDARLGSGTRTSAGQASNKAELL